jgi:drug/metabolite transporter (DMT)-like permease
MSGAEPFAALTFGFLIYSEVPTFLMFCGFLLTIISIMIIGKKENAKN